MNSNICTLRLGLGVKGGLVIGGAPVYIVVNEPFVYIQ